MAKRKHQGAEPGTPAFYEREAGSMMAWSRRAVRAIVGPGTGSTIFSMRFPLEELEALRQEALRQGTTVSNIIRAAVSAALYRRPTVVTNHLGRETLGASAKMRGLNATTPFCPVEPPTLA